ncbi:MAG: ATP-binding cassette domain-containing protein [Treponema sp.]
MKKSSLLYQPLYRPGKTVDICSTVCIEHLSFKYGSSGKPVFTDLCLTIKKGAYISVVGENGCGKSTLIKLILGLLKPDSGSIRCTPATIGYVPQKKTAAAGFPITVYEALNSYRILRKYRSKDIIDRCLSDVRLLEHKNALTSTLSGGQLQKMYIARALIGNPELLILDEPSTGIDIQSQQEIYAFIKRLNTEKRLTVISVEHNLDAAVLNSSDIFHLANGCGHLCNPQKYAAEFLKLKTAHEAMSTHVY